MAWFVCFSCLVFLMNAQGRLTVELSRPGGRRPEGGSSLGLVDTDVLRGSSLIVNGRSVAQGRVQALMVVVPEIASEFGAESSLGQEAGTMHEIGFERMKERFHVSVVPWSVATGHGLTNILDQECSHRKTRLNCGLRSIPRGLFLFDAF